MISWPKTRDRKHLIDHPRHGNGWEFYPYATNTIVFCIWGVAVGLFSAVVFHKSSHLSIIAGPITIVIIRVGFLLRERSLLADSLERHTRSMYVKSFARLDDDPDDASKPLSPVLFNAWHVVISMTAALVFIPLGAIVPSQRWALCMGLAIVVEFTVRVIIEWLWQKTRFGYATESWLKKMGWW